jgi:hypothetical protein
VEHCRLLLVSVALKACFDRASPSSDHCPQNVRCVAAAAETVHSAVVVPVVPALRLRCWQPAAACPPLSWRMGTLFWEFIAMHCGDCCAFAEHTWVALESALAGIDDYLGYLEATRRA